MRDTQNTAQYLVNSLRRLSIFADRPIRTKDDAFIALLEYERALVPAQAAVIKAWIKG